MSIAQSILDIALEEIAKQGCDRLDLIRVECGALAGVVPDSLQFCFEALVQGGPHAAARLELVTIPLLLRCSTCGQTFGGEGQEALWQPCPACGALTGHTVEQGKELQISHLEASVSGGQDS
ncbi:MULTISPECIES: hydrogenase maturation nickel metallochaperone HypA [Desulfovibrio]|nr:hydrogenase maturation nickel metallochaperone HypA [Desulfovibrio sp.]